MNYEPKLKYAIYWMSIERRISKLIRTPSTECRRLSNNVIYWMQKPSMIYWVIIEWKVSQYAISWMEYSISRYAICWIKYIKLSIMFFADWSVHNYLLLYPPVLLIYWVIIEWKVSQYAISWMEYSISRYAICWIKYIKLSIMFFADWSVHNYLLLYPPVNIKHINSAVPTNLSTVPAELNSVSSEQLHFQIINNNLSVTTNRGWIFYVRQLLCLI